MVVAGEWESLENGSRWRLGVARDWRMVGARECIGGALGTGTALQ
jgi:hypothetical protein